MVGGGQSVSRSVGGRQAGRQREQEKQRQQRDEQEAAAQRQRKRRSKAVPGTLRQAGCCCTQAGVAEGARGVEGRRCDDRRGGAMKGQERISHRLGSRKLRLQ